MSGTSLLALHRPVPRPTTNREKHHKKGSHMKKQYGKKVLITTERRGVFVGTLVRYEPTTRAATLANTCMAIYWGTTGGVLELASVGPTAKSRISPAVPTELRFELVECIVPLSETAEKAWHRYGV